MKLGEARSKIAHISGALLKPEVAAELHTVFLAKGVHATTAIEGNTLTEEQAQQLVEGTLRLPASQEYLAKEMDNIVAAFNSIRDHLLTGGPRALTPEMIKSFNRQVLDGLELEDGVVPGEVREHSVMVARYRGAPAEDCEYLLERLCEWLNGDSFTAGDDEWKLPFAILKAVAAHLYLAWIHPFGDGNGRTARLLELQILLAAGVPTPATHLFSNHYNQTRIEYQRRLDAASREGESGVLDFYRYAVSGFVDGLMEQLRQIREQQFDARWEQYIYETFGDVSTPTQMRRRQVMLDISAAKRPVTRAEIRALSVTLAEAYASKTVKTLNRDVNALVGMGLLETSVFRTEDGRPRVGFTPRRSIIQAFLPLAASEGKDEESATHDAR